MSSAAILGDRERSSGGPGSACGRSLLVWGAGRRVACAAQSVFSHAFSHVFSLALKWITDTQLESFRCNDLCFAEQHRPLQCIQSHRFKVNSCDL